MKANSSFSHYGVRLSVNGSVNMQVSFGSSVRSSARTNRSKASVVRCCAFLCRCVEVRQGLSSHSSVPLSLSRLCKSSDCPLMVSLVSAHNFNKFGVVAVLITINYKLIILIFTDHDFGAGIRALKSNLLGRSHRALPR